MTPTHSEPTTDVSLGSTLFRGHALDKAARMTPTHSEPTTDVSLPSVESTLFRGHASRVRYSVATERTKLCRNGDDSREIVNPDGTWHALDPETSELLCAFTGVVYRWDRYDFQASKHASRCLDCIKIVEGS